MRKKIGCAYYIKNTIVAIIIVLIFCCGFFTVANLIFYKTHLRERVKGFSMLPTLNSNVEDSNTSGDTVYVCPYAEVKVNDIVVSSPSWYQGLIIKRLVGLPGDKIQIKDLGDYYGLFVNDSMLYTRAKSNNSSYSGPNSHYQKYKSFLSNGDYVETENGESYIRLGDDDYFLIGDNWGYSLDSLSEGPVSRDEIVGKTNLIVDYTNTDRFVVVKHILKKIFSFN